ncbi:MAG: TIGR03067 domain-containing protein [Planctomycetes bacterium]|nr:TIGR03067 domain-containing protein [Planctomycetota bacterium]
MSQAEMKKKGAWRQVAVVTDKKSVPVGSSTLMSVDGDHYIVTVNGKPFQTGNVKVEGEHSPRQADVIVSDGPHAGKTLLLISKVEGDVLISCMAPPGAPRPTEFKSEPGSGHTLSVWLRTESTSVAPIAPLTRRTWLALGVLVFLALIAWSARGDLENNVAHWAAMLAGGVACMLLITAVGVYSRWPLPTTVATGLGFTIALGVLRKCVEQSHRQWVSLALLW